MKNIFNTHIIVLFTLFSSSAFANLKVMTTTTNLKSLVQEIGGDKVDVDSICKGTQDPHYIEAKPSFTLKASKADLLVSIGLDLEVGWLPLILRGARNPKLLDGGEGSFVAGQFIDTLEKPTSTISRSEGDVHPDGNPHFMLDPLNSIIVAEKLKEKLQKLDSENSLFYEAQFKKFSERMRMKVSEWRQRIKPGLKVITYHKTLSYFYERFKINNVAFLEPKPGVPPSASHILNVMKTAKEEGVKNVLVENYFDPTVAERVAKDVPGLKVNMVPVSVDGDPKITNLFELYESLVTTVEEK